MNGAFDKPIMDAVLMHALDVTRVEASQRVRVMKRLVRLQNELVAMVSAGAPKTKAATDALVARANKAITRCYDDIDKLMQPALKAIAKTQVENLVRAIERAPVGKKAS